MKEARPAAAPSPAAAAGRPGAEDAPARYLARALSISTVPTLSAVLEKALPLLDDAEGGLHELGRVIAADPALAARLLKAINSARYSFAGHVASVPVALNLLGVRAIRGLLLSTAVLELMREREMWPLWLHSVATARVAAALTRHLGWADGEDLEASALLHEFGRVVLAITLPDEVREIQAAVAAGERLDAAERRILGFDHARLGGDLFAAWRLPPRLWQAVAYHLRPAEAPEYPREAALVWAADLIARAIGMGDGAGDEIPPLDAAAFRLCGLEPIRLPVVVADAMDGIEDVEDEFEELKRGG